VVGETGVAQLQDQDSCTEQECQRVEDDDRELPIMTPCTIHKAYAAVETTYVRFEIASRSAERHALSTCGTRLNVVHEPATKPSATNRPSRVPHVEVI
jgi:hypothetical protein